MLNQVTVKKEQIPLGMSGASPGSFVKVSIRDNGNGILPDELPSIFEPFSSFSRIKKGSSLGLSIVKALLSEHGGFATVESTVGEGTKFHLYFPVVE